MGLGMLIGGIAAAPAQVLEDTLDPAELGIQGLDSLVTPAAHYVGNEVCAGCHPAAYDKWLGTRHARSFVRLHSGEARVIAEGEGLSSSLEPIRSALCLGCHATGHDAPAAYRDAGFHMGEGVACEKCHGPGGAHAAAMRGVSGEQGKPDVPGTSAGLETGPRLRIPEESFCLRCHRPKPSHVAVEDRLPFSYEKFLATIAHPEPAGP